MGRRITGHCPDCIYNEGWSACMAGKSEHSCPYTDAICRAAWMNGYMEAAEWYRNE